MTGPVVLQHVTPNQEHGLPLVSHCMGWVHPAAELLVDTNKSTSAARSCRPQFVY